MEKPELTDVEDDGIKRVTKSKKVKRMRQKGEDKDKEKENNKSDPEFSKMLGKV